MSEVFNHIVKEIYLSHINILLTLGVVLFGGTIGGRIFQKFKIPQVVSYIILGIILGGTGFNFITSDMLTRLKSINYFALGLISFSLGGELKLETLKKYGRMFFYLLFFEAFGASIAVFIGLSLLGFLFFSFKTAIVIAILTGAISAATAAAGTTDVLWEYKAKGIMTSALLGIVALDDVLALVLFAVLASFSNFIIGIHGNILLNIAMPIYELGVAVMFGYLSGVLLSRVLVKFTSEDKIFVFTIGLVIMLLGLSLTLKIDMLMAATVAGFVLSNRHSHKNKIVFELIEKFSGPIYILFFVFVGAKINVNNITGSIVLLGIVFIILRMAGKTIGIRLGSIFSGAPDKIKNYLPFALFSQSGVAIGLSILAFQKFPGVIGETVLFLVTTTTFVVQLIGPYFVKFAIDKSEETGLNITADDIIKQKKVSDIPLPDIPVLNEDMKLSEILKIYCENDYMRYPVVDKSKNIIGIISFENIKNALILPNIGDIVLATDVMTRLKKSIENSKTLFDAQELMKRKHLNYIPVQDNDGHIKGLLEMDMINHFVSRQLIGIVS